MSRIEAGLLAVLVAVSWSAVPARAADCGGGVQVTIDKKTANGKVLRSAEMNVLWRYDDGGTWKDAASCTYANESGKIDERMPVTVRVQNFNFLHYGIEFDIEEEVVAAYAELADFWSRFLNPQAFLKQLALGHDPSGTQPSCSLKGLLEKATAGADPKDDVPFNREISQCLADLDFEATTVAWRKKLGEGVEHLAGKLAPYRSRLGLTDTEKGQIEKDRVGNGQVLWLLERYRAASLLLALTNKQLDRYEKTRLGHDTVTGGFHRFNSRAKLVREGFAHRIKKKKPGTVVTVKMTPEGIEGAGGAAAAGADKQLAVDYFVQSKYPVLFHAGLSYSDVDEVQLEKVRTLAGSDLFSEIRDGESEIDLTTFLSWQFWSGGERSQQGVLLSVGTDVDEPGQRAYLGLSYRRGRWFLTGGWVRAEVEDGDEVAAEGMMAGGAAAPPEAGRLFETVRKGTEEGTFLAISFSVFGGD